MFTGCRATDETNEYLEAEARAEIEQEQRERRAEMFDDLDVQSCDECGDQFPATEFKHDGVCEGCAERGSYPNAHTFRSETGREYLI